MPEEKRRFPRQLVSKRTRVLLDQDRPPLDCIVFDLTNHGAGVKLALNKCASKRFELSFDNFRSRCHYHLAWQKNDKLGVFFFER